MSISNFKFQISNCSPRRAPWVFAICALLLAIALTPLPSALAQSVVPITNAHAHNDYEHTHPLFDALSCGLCSVEADVHLVDGQLLVAHNRWQTKAGRTLQSLYLDPLRDLVKKNNGHVYPNGPEFTLLIDLKDDWKASYPTLRHILEGYTDILTSFEEGKKHTNAITVIVTGNRSLNMFAGERVRLAAMDGDLPVLKTNAPADLVPWISRNWSQSFKWRGTGPMPADELSKLQDIVAQAHQQGRRVRFWGAPDKPPFWQTLRTNGVDLINTDDLEGVKKFFAAQPQPPAADSKPSPQAKAR